MADAVASTVITIAIKEALTLLIKPAIGAAFKGVAAVSEVAVDSFTNQFVYYVERQLEKHSYLSTLVFQNQILLEELYVPLTVQHVGDEEKYDNNFSLKIDAFSKDLFEEHRRILVTDTAGMGKSTLMKFLLIQCIRSNFAIPVFIELRHLSQTQTILKLIEQELNRDSLEAAPRFTPQKISKLLGKGKLVFFFDGYDEIAFKDREPVTKDIKNFIETYPENYFAITSRPESGLSSFPSFVQFRIRPLEKEESFSLIKKYDRNGIRSTQLIDRLKGRELSAVHEFLKNPLLTSLLYRCFEYKQNVPTKKHIFYRQVFDALFDWHDSSKDGYNTREKKSKLDLDSFHRVLRVIGFMSTINGEIEGDKDKVLGWIREAKSVCVGMSFSESDFLEDLTRAVPVFSRDGLFYKWSHKSLAEYFAAQYICTEGKDKQDEVFTYLKETGSLDRFQNMLDQIYDLDPPAFRKYFSLPLAQAFTDYRNSSYKKINPLISVDKIELRKQITFVSNYVLLRNGFPVNKGFRETMALLDVGNVSDVFDVGFGMGAFNAPKSNSRILIIMFRNSYSTIAEILQSKKDTLVVSNIQIESERTINFTITGLKNKFPHAVTDAFDNIINSKKNFHATTLALLQMPNPIALDGVACQKFCEHFTDEQQKEHFTKKLLSNAAAPKH